MKTPDQMILEAHRDNLIQATTFEQWREAHLKWLDLLIAKEELKSKVYVIEMDFIAPTQSVVRTYP